MMRLDEVLAALGPRMMHVGLVWTGSRWEASYKRRGGDAFKCGVSDDPVKALLEALGPRYGQSWEDHLGAPVEADEDDDDDIAALM